MLGVIEPLSKSVLTLMYFGDVVFAVSGALTAGKYRMDVVGFVLVGTITGIGGGTTRDLLLGRTVWWTQNPEELFLCVAAALITFFFVKDAAARSSWMNWSDALGLASFAVVGCHIALNFGVPFVIAVFMGMLTATGGGVIRDIITNQRPMIMGGQLYATAALSGALIYGALVHFLGAPEIVSELAGFLAALALRAAAIIFDIRMGPPGEFVRIGRPGDGR